MIPSNPEVTLANMDTWYSSYASGICLAAYVLLQEDLQAGQTECFGFSSQSNQPALATVPWSRIDTGDPNLSDGKLNKLFTMIHTLAVRTVSYFAVGLRKAIASDYPLDRESCMGTYTPSLPKRLPTFSLLELPTPFTNESMVDLPTCHLARMTDPAFFEDGRWTGYKSMTGIWGQQQDWFDPIGGENRNVEWNNVRIVQPDGRLGIERTLYFEFVEWTAQNKYKMRSNWVHTTTEIFKIDLAIDRQTGLAELNNTCYSGWPMGIYYGVMTPFGLVVWIYKQSYMWLWKTEWAELCT
ncbi:hypothetical protein BT63DRAFT_296462 [Microthyrium microscopicum]|uniref:Uncharacterized protein n=1 Tax=Microthyrium microscopicum TaxID=703497 RepID=A0A6A6U636_9PEZI|nr:hypothetical protein BT63DRAFT_296462 [Microthyrium microscopicum]